MSNNVTGSDTGFFNEISLRLLHMPLIVGNNELKDIAYP
jgi:hypothetical protein